MALEPTSNPDIAALAARLAGTDPGAANIISPGIAPQPSVAESVAPAAPSVGALPLTPSASTAPLTQVPAPQTPDKSFRDKIGAAAQQLGMNPKEPGSWAKALVASAVDALGGFDVGPVPPGAGGLYGAGVIANRMRAEQQAAADRAAAQRQQEIVNKREDVKLDLEKQKTAAFIAEANINEMHTAQMMGYEHAEHEQKIYQTAQTMAQPFKDEGAQELGHGLTSDQLKQMLQDKKLDLSQTHAFIDGFQPVLNPDGTQATDKNGVPRTQATWQLLGPVPEVTLDKNHADFLNKYGAGNFSEGTKMGGEVYYGLVKRAQQMQAVDLNVQKLQAEIAEHLTAAQRNKLEQRSKGLTVEQQEQNKKAMQLFAPYLAGANGDPILALQNMGRSKDAKSIGLVEQLYGPGNIEKARRDTLSQLSSTIAESQKVLAEHSQPGATPLPPDEEQELRDTIRQSQAMKNQYLGIHPADPPQVAASIEKLDPLPPDQRAAAIANSTTMPNAAKVYLLRHYNLPIPPTLQPAPVAQPAPAAQ